MEIMVADSEMVCTQYPVDFSGAAPSRIIGTRSLQAVYCLDPGPRSDIGNATIGPFSGATPTGTLSHVTGVSFAPLTEMPLLRGAASFQDLFDL